jgi:hypothetical protein
MKDQGHRAERWENYINLQIPERTSYLSHNTMAFILKAVLYLSVFLCVSGAVIPSDEDTELILVSVVSCKFFQLTARILQIERRIRVWVNILDLCLPHQLTFLTNQGCNVTVLLYSYLIIYNRI